MKRLFNIKHAEPVRFARILGATALALCTDPALAADAPARLKPDILLILADDLNDWIDPMAGCPQSKTPKLDRLANASCLRSKNSHQANAAAGSLTHHPCADNST